MTTEPKLIYHFTDLVNFELICLEKKGLAFPELEKAMYDYIRNQPKNSIEFKECWIHHEYVDEGEVRTVQITFQDDNINKAVRLWGAKLYDSGKVLKMTIDFMDLDTLEVEQELVIK
ncbi:hypothetical protein AB1I92_15650 [Bacillus mobilis]|uniref:Uncharacterized protein n=2 Tax=Bacillus cereus group TaxID=86661 RepID=A0A1C4EGR0_BACCE|nr:MULTISPECIES: hypothetical protein [Bacillus cereus group]OKA31978.1 hypothetical protein BJR06_28475 [Bacillus cereus]OKA32943.1 hypothetical protein BJR07_26895 [Bacillus cereus]SCC42682.1 Uncharacterized protein BC0861_04379 [Bacillus mobilis]